MSRYICPECSSELVLRRGKFGEFYGCSSYPSCRKSVPVAMIESCKDTGNGSAKKKLAYNDYQLNFFDGLQNTPDNIIMRACAGSGKTTTLEHGVQYVPQNKSVMYLVFGKKNEQEAQHKMPARCKVRTSHSFGLWTCRREMKGIKINPNKMTNLAYDYWKELVNGWRVEQNEKWKLTTHLYSTSVRTVSLLKNRLDQPTEAAIIEVLETYDIDMFPLSPYFGDFVRGVTHIYQTTADNRGEIDFDDMLFFPWYYDLTPPQFDFVFADEIQDFNASQINLVMKAVGERAAGVGDENQSIYGFRGAMLNSMEKFAQTLKCKPYPLSMTFRVPRIGVERVNNRFPDIEFLPWEGAIEGEIIDTRVDDFLLQAQDGDLVVCRNNAPLVAPVYRLLRQGKKAVIVGQNIGEGIKKLFDREDGVTERTTIGAALVPVIKGIQKKRDYYAEQEKWGKVAGLNDKISTIQELSDGCRTVGDLYNRIDLIFTDELTGIQFSTVHKAKGLEAKNVGILQPSLMPSGYASQDWELQQERNIMYVAETRFKEKMYLIEE